MAVGYNAQTAVLRHILKKGLLQYGKSFYSHCNSRGKNSFSSLLCRMYCIKCWICVALYVSGCQLSDCLCLVVTEEEGKVTNVAMKI